MLKPTKPVALDPSALDRYLERLPDEKFESFWRTQQAPSLPASLFGPDKRVWVEVGAGSGGFFVELARRLPDVSFIPIERCKERALTLIKRARRAGVTNLHPLRGNAVTTLLTAIPEGSVERLFILYPCPWPKPSHRKNRWYLHPIMPHFLKCLRPGGILVWASDQAFYLEEARYACRARFGLEELAYGPLTPSDYNCLALLPAGRSKFEQTFLAEGKTCHELIVRKPSH